MYYNNVAVTEEQKAKSFVDMDIPDGAQMVMTEAITKEGSLKNWWRFYPGEPQNEVMELSNEWDMIGFEAKKDIIFYGFAVQHSGNEDGALNLDVAWAVDYETSDEH